MDTSQYVILFNNGRITDNTLVLPDDITNVHFRSSKNSISNITLKYYDKSVTGVYTLTGTYLLEPGEPRDFNLNNEQFYKIEAVVPVDAWLDYEYVK